MSLAASSSTLLGPSHSPTLGHGKTVFLFRNLFGQKPVPGSEKGGDFCFKDRSFCLNCSLLYSQYLRQCWLRYNKYLLLLLLLLQSCLTLCDPMEGSLPGSSIHGIYRATVLEWGAIAFSL